MKYRLTSMITLLSLLFVQNTFAQIKIEGTVTELTGPLPGATVTIKNTTKGTVTDFDGHYSIEAKQGDVLVFSFLGHKTNERVVKASSKTIKIDVFLEEDSDTLDEVVLTYHGVKREQKALGFGVTKITSAEIEHKAEVDLTNSLQGKISGLEIIQTSGETGAESTVLIRSSLSITQESGGNSALIILDDVPYTGDLLDIDPNSVKNITVLKGLNATLEYGTDGRNGVIIVETHNGTPVLGEEKMTISFSRTDFINSISNLPKYQNRYGAGERNAYELDINSNNWGPRFGTLESVNSLLVDYPQDYPVRSQQSIPYEAVPDNISKLFKNEHGNLTSFRLANTNSKSAINFSLAYANEGGVIGKNKLERYNMGLGAAIKISDQLDVNLGIDYSNRATVRQSSNIFERILFLPRNIDLTTIPYQNAEGQNVYYQEDINNPLWLINNSANESKRNRVSTYLGLAYDFKDNFSASYRIGATISESTLFMYSNKGGVGDGHMNGFLALENDIETVLDQRIVVDASFDLSERIGLTSFFGAHSKINIDEHNGSESLNQITYGFNRPNNFTENNVYYSSSDKNIFGVYAQATLDYQDYVYLTLSARNDWASTLEPENRSIFYPSISISFLPLEALGFKSKTINYLKLRGSRAESVGFPGVYRTRQGFLGDPNGFVDRNSNNFITHFREEFFSNSNLKPELHREYEFGVEAKFFNSRLELEGSLYERRSFDQLTFVNIDPANGYSSSLVNLGRVDTKGIEIDLSGVVFQTKNLRWYIRNTFTTFKTEVIELFQEEVELSGGRLARVGEPLGVIKGSYALTDEEGNFLIDPGTGKIISSDEVNIPTVLPERIIADPTPDWRASSIHYFSYKNLTLGIQFEHTQGGTDKSTYAENLISKGVTKDTENREGSYVIDGVFGDPETGLPILNEDRQTIPNSVQITAHELYIKNYFEPDTNNLYDTTVSRIRELSLEYELGKKILSKLPLDRMSLKFSARNVFYHAPDFPRYTNIDPSISSRNVMTNPTTKRYGLSIIGYF